MNITILSAIWPESVAWLKSRHSCRVAEPLPRENLNAALADADAVILRSGVELDRAALDSAPSLRLIVRAGMGLENIDCAAAARRGVRVVCVPLSANSVAEHAVGLLLALSRRITRLDAALREGRWEKHAGYGRDLFGRCLGLLGFGRIGGRIAELASGFGMSVVAYDRSPEKRAKQEIAAKIGVRFVTLAELFSTADMISIQTPLDDSTRGLVDAALLATMKNDAMLINVGRGGVVDEVALDSALRQGRPAGAALDVFAREPPGKHPLLELPNFIGTPHVGAQTQESQEHVGRAVVRIIDAFADGGDWEAHGVVVV
jgi:D-3-phosphoglycerate dehydrogenase